MSCAVLVPFSGPFLVPESGIHNMFGQRATQSLICLSYCIVEATINKRGAVWFSFSHLLSRFADSCKALLLGSFMSLVWQQLIYSGNLICLHFPCIFPQTGSLELDALDGCLYTFNWRDFIDHVANSLWASSRQGFARGNLFLCQRKPLSGNYTKNGRILSC